MKKKGRLVDMKKLIVILFIIFGAFLTFSLYRTFAYDTSVVEEVPSTTDLEYTFKIGNSSIKQITVDSGETRYYDIVLSNPNNAKISYSIYYEMVSPSTKPDGFSIEYTSKSTGDSTGIVNNNGNITLNIVVTNTSSNAVTVKVGTVAGYVKGGELALNSGQVVIPKRVFPKATYVVEHLDDGTTGDSGSGVYKITHSAIPAESSATGSEIPAVNDYRYYGASPNNYVCLDMEGQSICPDKNLFRMIGSIYEENASQNLIKVIKATALTAGTNGNFSWDYKVNNRFISYNNIWSTTTSGTSSGAILMQILNDIYLTKGTRDYYFPVSEADDYQIFSVSFADTGLSAVAQNLINSGIDNKLSRYYLGGFSSSNLKINTIYSAERGRTTSNGNALYWDGKVGLMYPSDYGYAAGNDCVTNTDAYSYDKCSDKNWIDLKNIYELFMTSVATSEKLVFNSDRFGKICEVSSSTPRYARPVFYLSSDVSITSGTGTSSDPYIISK